MGICVYKLLELSTKEPIAHVYSYVFATIAFLCLLGFATIHFCNLSPLWPFWFWTIFANICLLQPFCFVTIQFCNLHKSFHLQAISASMNMDGKLKERNTSQQLIMVKNNVSNIIFIFLMKYCVNHYEIITSISKNKMKEILTKN